MHEGPGEAIAEARIGLTRAVAPWWHTAILVLLLVGTFVAGRAGSASRCAQRQHHVGRYLVGIGAEWVLLLLTWWGCA